MILGAGINNSILVVVLASAVVYGTPLLYAALGELLAERSGVLNLGVEGMMLVGAVMGFWAVQRVGNLAVAVLVAAVAGAAMAAIHAFLVVTLRANRDRWIAACPAELPPPTTYTSRPSISRAAVIAAP